MIVKKAPATRGPYTSTILQLNVPERIVCLIRTIPRNSTFSSCVAPVNNEVLICLFFRLNSEILVQVCGTRHGFHPDYVPLALAPSAADTSANLISLAATPAVLSFNNNTLAVCSITDRSVNTEQRWMYIKS